MQMMPQMGPPRKSTWKDQVQQLDVQIANTEMSLILAKAQLKEAKSHLSEDEPEEDSNK